MNRLRQTLILIAVTGLLSGRASATDNPRLAFEEVTLANGMKVVLHEDHTLPIVALNLWYKVGSRDEQPGRSGFAHLFEHLMFMGTERVPNFDVVMEGGGAWNNASTSEDRTNYYSVGPANMVDTLLWLDADRLDSLDDTMTQAKLDLQRDVVRNERRQSYENQPYGQTWLIIPNEMYPEGHPYHDPVIGSHEDLESATVDDVVSFFRTWYIPANASLVLAGDFDPEKVKPLIEDYFGSIESNPPPASLGEVPMPTFAAKTVAITDDVQLPQVTMVWHSAPFMKPGDAELDVASSVLAGSKNSRLYKSLVYDKEIANDVSAYQASMSLSSLFIIEATAQPGHTLEELEAAIDAELQTLRTEVPTQRELDRAKNNIETNFVRRIEAVNARADLLNQYLFLTGSPDYLQQDLARYQAITPEDVQKVVSETLLEGNRFTLETRPEPAALEATGGQE